MGIISWLRGIIRRYRTPDSHTTPNGTPSITIYHRSDNTSSIGSTGRITILSQHPQQIHSPTTEVVVTNPNLGHGMTITHQTKPTICSLCRTRGQIVENTSGSGKWRCNVCGNTFN